MPKDSNALVNVGVIGYGHWGPNHVRVFNQLPGSTVRFVVDMAASRLLDVKHQFAHIETSTRFEDLLNHAEVDAVVIATPTTTHHSLVKAALLAGKDVLVEKPITYTVVEASELIQLANQLGRVLMCGHIFLFNAGIRKLRNYISNGTLGQVYYMAATRTGLGPLRRDVNALFDLGSHDVSIFNYLLDACPSEVAAWGECYLQQNIEDVAFACLEYPNRTLCHVHVSWLNPRKERSLVIVGEKKMAVWDDTSQSESIRLYDKGLMHPPFYDSFGQFQLVLRDADVLIPKLNVVEPLKLQAEHFLECVHSRMRPLTNASFARDVLLTVEALQHSLRRGGARQRVETAPQPEPAGAASVNGPPR